MFYIEIMYDVWSLGISIGIGIISGLISGLIVRYATISKYEKNFQKNTKTIYNEIFACISRIDYYKENMYDMLESGYSYKNSERRKNFQPHVYNSIKTLRNWITDEIEHMTFYKNSPYVLLSEYILLLQYCSSARDYSYEISNEDNVMGVDEKTRKYHIFYAKEIITMFKTKVPEDFINKWNPVFEKFGGPTRITKPSMELGEVHTSHHNIKNQLVHFDAKYSSIMKQLHEIKQTISKE